MTILYYLFTGFVAAAALFILLTPHVHYAALGLISVILGMAILYFLQGAALVAVIQVIIYIGGVLLLLLLSTMLLPSTATKPLKLLRWQYLLPTAGVLGWMLWQWICFAVRTLPQEVPAPNPTAHPITTLGLQLLGSYAWAFEWTGLVLLITLVGAVYIASSQQDKC